MALDRACQRDDWSRRPLTTRQMVYAAQDASPDPAAPRPGVRPRGPKGRLEWAREEFEHIARRAWTPREFDREEFWGWRGRAIWSRAAPPRSGSCTRRERAPEPPMCRSASSPTDRGAGATHAEGGRRPDGIRGFTPLVPPDRPPVLEAASPRRWRSPRDQWPKPPRTQGRRRTAAFRARASSVRAPGAVNVPPTSPSSPGVPFPQSTLEGLADRGLEALEDAVAIPGLRRWRKGILLPDAARLLA